MKRLVLCLSILSVIAVAIWAYGVNYRTRQAFDRLDALRAELSAEREMAQVLRVEWAWLNAPDRLERLVAQHNDRLRLTRLAPDRFGFVATVPYPPPVSLDERMMAELSETARAIAGAPPQEGAQALSDQSSGDADLGMPLPPIRPAAWSGR
ncbi:MAG: cell division protein FtsL [Pseudomonadota bacterium]